MMYSYWTPLIKSKKKKLIRFLLKFLSRRLLLTVFPQKKKHCRSSDVVDENLAPKNHKSKKSSDDAKQLTEANMKKPLLPTLVINLGAKEKGSCSNPLMKESLAFAAGLVAEWLSQNCAQIAELETLPDKLKSTKLDLKKAIDKVDVSQTHLKSMEADLNKKLEDQERRHQEPIQNMQEDHKADILTLDEEKNQYASDLIGSKALSEAQEKIQQWQRDHAGIACEAIINYVASDTFVAARLEDLWERMTKHITPRFTQYVTHLKGSPNPQDLKWDPEWLIYEKVYTFCKSWGATPKATHNPPPFPIRPTSKQCLWDLEKIGQNRRNQKRLDIEKKKKEAAKKPKTSISGTTSGKPPRVAASGFLLPFVNVPINAQKGSKASKEIG